MRNYALLIALLVLSSLNISAKEQLPALATEADGKIWSTVPFLRAGNLHEFQAELSKTREQARGQLLNEFGSMLMPLAMSTPDVAGLAMVLANIIKDFDRLVRQHAEA